MKQAVDDMYDVLLRDGGIAQIRALRPSDREALHDLVDRTSERSTFLRFFTGGKGSAHAHMDRLTDPGYRGRAMVGFVQERLAAVAECTPDETGRTGEIGILIDDKLHGQGLGTLLIEHLALDAMDEGMQELVANVLPENRMMLRVLDDLGLETTRRHRDGRTEVRIILTPTPRLQQTVDSREHEAGRTSLRRLFSPSSVAVIGAGRDPANVGHRVLRNLIDGGFPGPIYPVNPHARELCGLTAYPDLREVPGPVDLAVIATPAAAVLDAARTCGERGVRNLVVVSAGFAEADRAAAEDELVWICRKAGMRLVGPNCLGIVNTAARLNASFLPGMPRRGRLGLMSQSGAVAVAVIDRAGELGLGVSSFASVGNKADISGNDLLEYWEDDPDTGVIGLYLESFGNPRRFGRIARRISRHKPIVAVKSGRTASGDRAVRSHTAAAATPDVAVEALLKASGVIRVDGIQELLDTARLLAVQPLPRGRRVAIVGNSGGPQVLTADACERLGLEVPELSPATQQTLRARVRPAAALGNPVDLTADADAEELGFAVATVLADPGVDSVLVVYTPPFGSGLEASQAAIAKATRDTGKTVLACVVGHDGLIDERVPSYAFPEQAVAALARVAEHAAWRARPREQVEVKPRVDRKSARVVVAGDLLRHPEGRWLDHPTAARLLGHYGVHVAETRTADSPEAAAEAAAAMGLPAVLKATGPGLVHKSDVGGVVVGLATPQEVEQAYRDMAERIGPAMTGALVQRMAEAGTEIIIGGVQHETFGPLVMVGMGGVTAEILRDQAFRIPPLDLRDAAEMIGELRGAPLLYGYRGRPKADIEALAQQIVRVGALLDDLPEVAELDLNPVIATPSGALAVDVRIRVAPAPPRPSSYRRWMRRAR